MKRVISDELLQNCSSSGCYQQQMETNGCWQRAERQKKTASSLLTPATLYPSNTILFQCPKCKTYGRYSGIEKKILRRKQQGLQPGGLHSGHRSRGWVNSKCFPKSLFVWSWVFECVYQLFWAWWILSLVQCELTRARKHTDWLIWLVDITTVSGYMLSITANRMILKNSADNDVWGDLLLLHFLCYLSMPF